jgi:hypothetical protein
MLGRHDSKGKFKICFILHLLPEFSTGSILRTSAEETFLLAEELAGSSKSSENTYGSEGAGPFDASIMKLNKQNLLQQDMAARKLEEQTSRNQRGRK